MSTGGSLKVERCQIVKAEFHHRHVHQVGRFDCGCLRAWAAGVLIAWFHPDDEFAGVVTPWVREHVTDFVWNPILRAEVRHTQGDRVPEVSPP